MRNLFDLLAELVLKLTSLPDHSDPEELTEESEERLYNEVQSFVNLYSKDLDGAARFGIPSNAYDDIITWANARNNYYLYRILLCALDNMPCLGFEAIASQNRLIAFESLNDNLSQTGILILPKVPSPATTFLRTSDGSEIDEVPTIRKTADEWSDNLNTRLNNFYYVSQNELQGYTLQNYVCDFTHNDPTIKELKIGVAPLLNNPLSEVFSYNDAILESDDSGNEYRLFDILGIKMQEEILLRTQACYKTASMHDVDILIFPEMFGVKELYQLDEFGFNPTFRSLCKETYESVPSLTLAPSLWEDHKNIVNVYCSSGKKLCTQHKQFRYMFNGHYGKCKENLREIQKTICLIHVPHWGRIAIPICIDFLHSEYRQLLISKLKTNILLCPSYSPGEFNFLNALDGYSEYGVYAVWVNSCSALNHGQPTIPELVGAASAPVVSSQSRIARFSPRCDGHCNKGCLFVATLPLDCAGDSPYEGQGINVNHIINPEHD